MGKSTANSFFPLLLTALFASAAVSAAESPHRCQTAPAQSHLELGMSQQSELETEAALKEYESCLQAEPACLACLYERGWSYWKLGRWEDVIKSWEQVLKLDPTHPEARQFQHAARDNLNSIKTHASPTFRTGVELGAHSKPDDAPVSLMFSSRRQSYNPTPASPLDHYDGAIHSPKSVRFSLDGKKVYVNSLEAGKTVIYDALGVDRQTVIKHKFTEDDAKLFAGDRGPIWDYRFPKSIKTPNEFFGKPVELELTHGGKYLWAPYYRRDFDPNGTMPSAVAVIDTDRSEIVRVIGTGPISKYVRASPKGRWLAISHWGDNSVGLIDIRGNDPAKFHRTELLTVEKRAKLTKVSGDRDKNCGFCVRGLAFTPDEKYLFVSRMKGGGIAVFELHHHGHHKYLGSVFGLLPGPRDLDLSRDGQDLFISCNASGYIARVPAKNLLEALRDPSKFAPPAPKHPPATPSVPDRVTIDRKLIGARIAYVGLGARSLRLSPDERFVFVAVNQSSEVVVVSTEEMRIVSRIPVDSYPVGLDLSPDGTQLWVTSQGRDEEGGNSVGIFQVRYKSAEVVHALPSPRPSPSRTP